MSESNETNIVNEDNDEMRPEYGPEFFARAERGKYYYKMRRDALQKELENSALLAPDVRAAFPTDAAVNSALRRLMRESKKAAPQTDENATTSV